MQFRFEIPLLARRSILVTRWTMRQPDLQELPIGLFGASASAAAALITAANLSGRILAVVLRSGRRDLAEQVLDEVQAPTLLVVGSEDYTVLDLNRKAASRMLCQNRLHIVPGATQQFEEPGALEEVPKPQASGFWSICRTAMYRPERTNLTCTNQRTQRSRDWELSPSPASLIRIAKRGGKYVADEAKAISRRQ